MIETRGFAVLLLFLVFSALSSTATAEMPYQDLDDAAYIFEGNVTEVEKSPNDGDFESRYHDAYVIHVFVHNVKRGNLATGKTFKVHIFDNRRRLELNLNDGWVGPAGHMGMPDVGQWIEVYAHKDHRGIYPIWFIAP